MGQSRAGSGDAREDQPSGSGGPARRTPSVTASTARASARRRPSGTWSSKSSSSRGIRTKRRARTCGWGRVRRGPEWSRAPSRRMSTSIGRGPWRGPPGRRPRSASTALHAASRSSGGRRRVDAQARVEEGRLVEELADGVGVVGRGRGERRHAAGAQAGDRRHEVLPAPTDVGAEAEVADHRRRPIRSVTSYSGGSRQTSTETCSTGRGIGGSGLAALTQTDWAAKSSIRRSAITVQRRSSVR